jgi:molybdopterin/thiamine biosynthesis adenylyltransferase
MTDVSRTALLAGQVLGGHQGGDRLAALREQPTALVLAPALAETRRGQIMLLTAATLLGRLFDYAPAIVVDAGHATAQAGLPGIEAGRPLGEQIVAHLRALPRRGAPYRYEEGHAAGARRALVVGEATVTAHNVVHVDGSGWRAAFGTRPPALVPGDGDPHVPFGPLVAAALGVAEMARLVFRSLAPAPAPGLAAATPERFAWNLWTHEMGAAVDGGGPAPVRKHWPRLGRVAVVGMGALGAAAVWAMAHLSAATGEITLVDDDRLEHTNLERVLGARRGDLRRFKVDLGARTLAATPLETQAVRRRFGDWRPSGTDPRTWLVGVDSGEVRRAIAREAPHAVYNGGTQGSEFLVSRHVGADGPCLACLYPDLPDPVGRTARRLGVDRATAAALVAGERRLDAGILDAMHRRGGIHMRDADYESLCDQPLAALESGICARAVVIEDLPEASVGFTAALCGFLMTVEMVKDRVATAPRATPLDPARCVLRADPLASPVSPESIESYVPRRGCQCGRRPPR